MYVHLVVTCHLHLHFGQNDWDLLRSCQSLLGVNLSPEFVNLYIAYVGWGLCLFAGGSGILNSNWHVWQWKEEAMCEIPMCNFKSHFSNKIS